jgi:hypothetical protein
MAQPSFSGRPSQGEYPDYARAQLDTEECPEPQSRVALLCALDSDTIPYKLFVERIESWHLRCVKFAQHQQFPVSACLPLPVGGLTEAIRPFLRTPFQAGDENDTLRIGARSIADHEIGPAMWLVLVQGAYRAIRTPLCIYQFPNRTINLLGGMWQTGHTAVQCEVC